MVVPSSTGHQKQKRFLQQSKPPETDHKILFSQEHQWRKQRCPSQSCSPWWDRRRAVMRSPALDAWSWWSRYPPWWTQFKRQGYYKYQESGMCRRTINHTRVCSPQAWSFSGVSSLFSFCIKSRKVIREIKHKYWNVVGLIQLCQHLWHFVDNTKQFRLIQHLK